MAGKPNKGEACLAPTGSGSASTLADRVRQAARVLGCFMPAALVEAVGPQTYIEARRIRDAFRDLRRAGWINGVANGYYVYVEKQRPRTQMDVIWHLVRSHRQFSTDEIERLSGAARDTVSEYLRCLESLGILRRPARPGSPQAAPGQWQLVTDLGPETPVNAAKCQRLKKIRKNFNRE